MNILLIGVSVAALVVVVLAALSVRVVRPTHRGLVERLGKYNRYASPAFISSSPWWSACSGWTSGRCWWKPSPR